jgi:hypothetical protein
MTHIVDPRHRGTFPKPGPAPNYGCWIAAQRRWLLVMASRTGSWERIKFPYLGQGTVPLRIPLLAVQADLNALAQKEQGPQKHIPCWARVPVVHGEVQQP